MKYTKDVSIRCKQSIKEPSFEGSGGAIRVYRRQSPAFVSAVVNPFAFIKELHVLPSADSPILVDVAFLFFHCDRKFVDWYRYRPSVLALWFRYLESLADQSLITNVTHMCIRYYTA